MVDRRWLCTLVITFASCKKADPGPPPRPELDEYAKGMEGLADKICACKDMICSGAISQEMVAFSEAFRKAHPDRQLGSDAQEKRSADASRRYNECSSASTKVKMGTHESFVIAMEAFTKRVCECADLRCVETVQDQRREWIADPASIEALKSQTATPEQEQRKVALNKRHEECMAKHLAGAQAQLEASPDAAPKVPENLSPGCAKFKATVEAFASCDKTTPAIRDNLFKAYSDLEKTDALCLEGIKALAEPAGRMGCKLPE